MRKVIFALVAAALVSNASAAEKMGFFLVGGQYERDTNATDSLRFGVGLPVAGFFSGGGAFALSGDAAFLRHTPRNDKVQPYYGAGLGLGAVFMKAEGSSATIFNVYPHVLGGLNFNVAPKWDLFAEASVGPQVMFGSGTGGTGTSFIFGYGLRLGANYTFR